VKNAEQLVFPSFAAARLRVALVTETFAPEVNGVAMTLGNLVKGLLQRGHTAQILRPQQANESDAAPWTTTHATTRAGLDEVLAKGVPIPNYPDMRFGLLSTRRLAQLWRQRRPDIVHVATEGPLGWCAVAAARKLRLPVSSSFHTNFHQYSTHYGMGLLKLSIEAYLRNFHNRTQITLAPTQAVAQTLRNSGYRNVSIMSRGVAIEQFSPSLRSATLRGAWGASKNDVVVLYVGRLAKEKNAGVVLSAFAAIQSRLPTAKLVFVGDGPLRQALQAACPQAVFAGIKTGTALATHYASSDLFLFPSLTETFGNVVPEALASGTAVVSYACAAAANLIRHDHNGALVAPGEEAQFLQTAVALANDEDRRNRLRLAAAPSVAHMSWAAVTDGFISTLRSVIDGHDNDNRRFASALHSATSPSPLTQPGQPSA
jgi:glycosyltransferase involved in cell wall biosynthesis